MEFITFLFMKNGFNLLFLLYLLGLTSCNSNHDTSLTDAVTITEELALMDSIAAERSFSLPNPLVADSSKYYFFIENEAGVVDYQRYDFIQKIWSPITSLFQKSFIGGPLHTGRIIYQQALWRDSNRYLLLCKDLNQAMVLEVIPLAEIAINNDLSQSIFIMVPKESAYRLSDCNHFDEWFTYCNQQRFFVQYWIEQQFAPRYIHRIQWKPFIIKND